MISDAVRYNVLYFVLGILYLFLSAGDLFAGWMGFRNDTKKTIIIQEVFAGNPQPRLGRPQKLFAGEAVRDRPAFPGQRKFNIFDGKNPNQPIYVGTFLNPQPKDNILYSIKSDGKGGVTVEAITSNPGTMK